MRTTCSARGGNCYIRFRKALQPLDQSALRACIAKHLSSPPTMRAQEGLKDMI